ncbi:MAG: molybdate ABC transporter substrate-binding protein [Chloroflexi bacterium]|nr:MAG: molybdate ABC transporter substrate-binding protein [Chloroflexota bacterium]
MHQGKNDATISNVVYPILKYLVSASVILGLFLSACTRGANSSTQRKDNVLVVFAAASLIDAFQEIGTRFEEQHPGLQVTFNFAGSQQLAQQISQGAEADVFASADAESMERVISNGQVVTGSQQVFAQNQLIVVLPVGSTAGIETLAGLANPGLRLVFAGEDVPAGKYTREFLQKASQDPALGADFEERVQANVISYEATVRGVYNKVLLGEADAGVVYQSDVSGDEDRVDVLEIPPNLNILAEYYIATTNIAAQKDLAEAFIQFVLSDEGQQIISSYGFISIP